MSDKSSDIVFSWSESLKGLAALLFLLGLGFALSRADSLLFELLGYVLMGSAVFALFYLPRMGSWGTKAKCPLCGNELGMVGYDARYVRCNKCQEYFEGHDKKLQQMDTQHVADEPQFAAELPWKDLEYATYPIIHFELNDLLFEKLMTKDGAKRILPATWPQGCCVCGEETQREVTVTRLVIKHPEGVAIRDEEIILIAQGVPHCNKDTDGARFDRISGEKGWYLKFRSYRYRNEFHQLNRWGTHYLDLK
jgi:hypothetical protein